ncbi:DUF2288 domain-containing protein [Geomesophilobacter sediminis]|uniref:DUF2288 domain-containing protein n=1 Tax=Geomesophilobacter sediminis TaxID=2798584 RepID=A0A8J7JMS6_9BACT|nr:DUF2288 domain-containing protein [Geomesophilobacter sediminis]MBJ6726125.1 DUF2288 domain-containing protein [Geomesophilobacter sediminis]
MKVSQEELAKQIDVTDWFTLRAHLERGGLILVDRMLNLTEVGFAVASDDVQLIERWIASGMVGKPTAAQIETWDLERTRAFACLITSPYVLIQEAPTENE